MTGALMYKVSKKGSKPIWTMAGFKVVGHNKGGGEEKREMG